MDGTQLKDLVQRTLKEIELWSPEAEQLILGTIAHESRNGWYIKQIKGPALGICQMEPATFRDHKKWLVNSNVPLLLKLEQIGEMKAENLEWNLKLSIAMCRIHYLRKPGFIPTTVTGQAEYWKKWYNTRLGKGTIAQYLGSYADYIGPIE
jgi:hypothetical protein